MLFRSASGSKNVSFLLCQRQTENRTNIQHCILPPPTFSDTRKFKVFFFGELRILHSAKGIYSLLNKCKQVFPSEKCKKKIKLKCVSSKSEKVLTLRQRGELWWMKSCFANVSPISIFLSKWHIFVFANPKSAVICNFDLFIIPLTTHWIQMKLIRNSSDNF